MTSKHTPGPWRATVALNENLVTVYTVRDSDNLPVGRGFKASDTLLMAAAPDLLEALKGLIDYAAQEIGVDPAEAVGGPFKPARDAIAKAEGQPS